VTRWAFLDHPGPLPIAHRGGAKEAPENTVAAFQAAWNLGFRHLETDAHVTADGEVVAFHDEHLDRVTGRPGHIEDHLWSELRDARVEGEPIPLLADLLTTFPDARFNIDAKTGTVVDPLLRVLRHLGALDRVCLGSFSELRLQRIRDLTHGRVCTTLGPSSIGYVRMASWRIGKGYPKGDAAQVPPTYRRVPLVTRRFVDHAHERGIPVHVWTIDDPAEMRRLLDIGVDGLFTDRPSVLRRVLIERGEWHA